MGGPERASCCRYPTRRLHREHQIRLPLGRERQWTSHRETVPDHMSQVNSHHQTSSQYFTTLEDEVSRNAPLLPMLSNEEQVKNRR